jgi:hypothetical protein
VLRRRKLPQGVPVCCSQAARRGNNGRKIDLLGLITTVEAETQDWLAERIGFELVVAFCRRIALYWPTRCVFRLSAANGESISEESGRLHGAGPCRCELKVSFLSSVRIAKCHLLRIALHVACISLRISLRGFDLRVCVISAVQHAFPTIICRFPVRESRFCTLQRCLEQFHASALYPKTRRGKSAVPTLLILQAQPRNQLAALASCYQS